MGEQRVSLIELLFGVAYASFQITPRRILAAGDIVVAEVQTDYGPGYVYDSVFIFELRDGKIATEHAYWPEPIPAADWRTQWVEKIPEL